MPEHDSSGEFIFLVAEYYRYTGDRELLEDHVAAGAGGRPTIWNRLLAERDGPPSTGIRHRREFYGILPPSISHEGYSAKPMHSYWDDFFALRGFKDAAWLADELGHDGERPRLAGILRDDSQPIWAPRSTAAMARARHRLRARLRGPRRFRRHLDDHRPVSGRRAQDILPAGALERTFERY